MKNQILFLFFLLIFVFNLSQAQRSPTNLEFEAQAFGGKEQIEQVFETQFSLPKIILNNNLEREILIFFDIDSTYHVANIKFENGVNSLLTNEIKRVLKFIKFKHTLNLPNESRPYFLKFSVSEKKYKSYFKQKNKFTINKNLSADSSFILYTKAEVSPKYFKNDDDGLSEFILSEIEYPKIATQKSIEGTVLIDFVVETNGFITNIVVKKSINAGCTEEAVRIIKLTKWQPAILNNKFVRYLVSYPVTFNLRNTNRDNGTSSQ